MLHSSAPIVADGKVLGVVTSSGYGHTVKKNICYAYISVEDIRPEESYAIEAYRQVYKARLEPSRVLYDPERKKILM